MIVISQFFLNPSLWPLPFNLLFSLMFLLLLLIIITKQISVYFFRTAIKPIKFDSQLAIATLKTNEKLDQTQLLLFSQLVFNILIGFVVHNYLIAHTHEITSHLMYNRSLNRMSDVLFLLLTIRATTNWLNKPTHNRKHNSFNFLRFFQFYEFKHLFSSHLISHLIEDATTRLSSIFASI